MAVEHISAGSEEALAPAVQVINSRVATSGAAQLWLAFADEQAEGWLRDLAPDSGLAIEGERRGFLAWLRGRRPRMVILVAPPAGPADLRLVARERELHSGLGLVVLSPPEAVALRIQALQLGFDEAIDLSADPAEVRARLSRAGGRSATDGDANLVWVGPDAQLDICARILWQAGTPHHVRPRDFELLRFLIDQPGQAFTRRELLEAWPGSHVSLRMIDVTIWRLRALIEEDVRAPQLFITVPRVGYRYDPPGNRR